MFKDQSKIDNQSINKETVIHEKKTNLHIKLQSLTINRIRWPKNL